MEPEVDAPSRRAAWEGAAVRVAPPAGVGWAGYKLDVSSSVLVTYSTPSDALTGAHHLGATLRGMSFPLQVAVTEVTVGYGPPGVTIELALSTPVK